MLKEGLSIDTTFNPHQFSSDSTFKALFLLFGIERFIDKYIHYLRN